MKILVINSGSSSLKFSLFDMKNEEVLAKGAIERISEENSEGIFVSGGEKERIKRRIKDHFEAVIWAEEILSERKILENFDSLSAIGHRVVHGGEEFTDSVLIDERVTKKIRSLFHLAPLHNPANLAGIEAFFRKAPSVLQVAVFDTAFHKTIPLKASVYALKYEFYEKYKIKRYGFHGISHRYVAKEAAKYLKKPLKDLNLITLHLGNGASVAAIGGGESVDTSMGMTPLEGLVMGTRCGDLDPGVLIYLMQEKGMDADDIERVLNKESGLKGLCGMNDLREIKRAFDAGDERAKLALEIFCYRIKKYIGAYFAVLSRVDALVFTAGIGENSSFVREEVLRDMEFFGLKIDKEANDSGKTLISSCDSKVKVLVVKTDEEIEIARECLRFL